MIDPATFPVSGLAGFSATAALCDARWLRIPNPIVLALLALFLIHAAMSLDVAATLTGLGLGVATLIIGFFGNLRGWFGAGDAKLLAVSMAWAGLPHALTLLLVMAVVGGAIALLLMSPYAAALVAPLRRGWPATATKSPMPYGVAIAAGACAVAAQLLHALGA